MSDKPKPGMGPPIMKDILPYISRSAPLVTLSVSCCSCGKLEQSRTPIHNLGPATRDLACILASRGWAEGKEGTALNIFCDNCKKKG